MKVVQINAVCGIGSTGIIAKEISLILNKHNIENYIFYASGASDYKRSERISNDMDMKVHAFLSHLTGKQAYFSRHSTKKLLDRLDMIKPDVVHLHNLHNNYVNLNMLLNYLSEHDIKTVITLHDCWYFTGKCTHYSNVKCSKWKSGCGKCPLLKADNPSWFFDRTKLIWNDKKRYLSKIKRLEIVGVSNWIAEEARQSFLNCGRISVIHNGIDTKTFTPDGQGMRTKYGLEGKFIILGMANKWRSGSNEDLLDFIATSLDDDYCILLLGGKTAARENNIIYVPYISGSAKLAEVYRTADVFVNVTHEDSLPTVNLEAMGCGTPVITYDVCGSTETVTDKTGIIVAEGDKDGLIDAISQVKNKGKDYYAKACREHILSNYELNKQFEQYIDIYKRDSNEENYKV